jgi:hypothetical protein
LPRRRQVESAGALDGRLGRTFLIQRFAPAG